MSIVVGIAVPEGLVLVADSRMTYGNPQGHPKIGTNNAQKLIQLNERMAMASVGWAYLNGKTIYGLMQDFKRTLAANATFDTATPVLIDFFQAQFDQHMAAKFDDPIPPGYSAIGIIVAGYDGEGVGHISRYDIPGKVHMLTFSTSAPGPIWAGQTDVIVRLMKGFDPRLNLSDLEPETVRKILERLQACQYVIRFEKMPLQDAIDLAIFLARATIQMQRFSDGILCTPGDVQGVGGPIDVAIITPEGFQWIQKKELHGEVPSTLGNISSLAEREVRSQWGPSIP